MKKNMPVTNNKEIKKRNKNQITIVLLLLLHHTHHLLISSKRRANKSTVDLLLTEKKKQTISVEIITIPSPSLSNRLKASLNSAICSSVSCSVMLLLQTDTPGFVLA
jgi:hypothetical protein